MKNQISLSNNEKLLPNHSEIRPVATIVLTFGLKKERYGFLTLNGIYKN